MLRSEASRIGTRAGQGQPQRPEKRGRKQRPADVGRALRTVYDDTLRECVPDDFLDLLGKLS